MSTDKTTLPRIATLGSHSALDVCRGAKDEGFETVVVAQEGRDKTYGRYYKSQAGTGCVDECLVVKKFDELLGEDLQKKLQQRNVIFIPNRSFEVYLHFDYNAIENNFKVPLFGNKYLLKIEERNAEFNQYTLLEKAGIRFPRRITDPQKIDTLCLVKVQEKQRAYERAFFLAKNFQEYQSISTQMLAAGKIDQKSLDEAVIEEFVIGPQVNFNFFYSPLHKRLELLGTDTRRQTNLDGILRMPAPHQSEILKEVPVTYEEAGHIAVTVLESLLEQAFEMGEAFVEAAAKLCDPGVIGPFALQAIIAAGKSKKELVVVDVSPRMPGSPGISATPYSRYLFGESLSVGQRVAKEIKEAHEMNKLGQVLT
jgi:5-formaminoimidazole-4-carboxamide-1-(beta)-D-ribofuranosyl 5'-monophosphate synthetase